MSKPGESFNGVSTVTFRADDIASPSSSSSVSSASTLESDFARESEDSQQTFDVKFFLCPEGNVWTSGLSDGDVDVDSADACNLCTDVIQGAMEVMPRALFQPYPF